MVTIFIIIALVVLVIILCNSNKDSFYVPVRFANITKGGCYSKCTKSLRENCDIDVEDLYGHDICRACYYDIADVTPSREEADSEYSNLTSTNLTSNQKNCACKAICQAKYGSNVVAKLNCYDRCSFYINCDKGYACPK